MDSSPTKEIVLSKRKLKPREFRWPKITQLGNHIEFGLINTRLFLCPHMGQTIQPLLLEKESSLWSPHLYLPLQENILISHTFMSGITQNWALKNPCISMATAKSVLNPHSPFHTIHLKAVLPTGWYSWLQQRSRSRETHLKSRMLSCSHRA